MPHAAARIAEFVAGLEYDQLPADVREAAKLHFLDTLGCALGAHALGVTGHACDAMAEAGGDGRASAIGYPAGLPAASASFVNGVLAHALDFDDTHPDAICHVSTVVCPAALAAAETEATDGRDLLVALVAGNEVIARIGSAAASAYMKTGFHPTSVCGVFGAAAASAKLSRLDAHGTVQALGIAGSMASGLFEYLADGSITKVLHAGWAAHGGFMAARLAAHGATGPTSVLEGRFGLFQTYFRLDGSEMAAQLADLGERWETPRIAFKPYPACHFIHPCLDAAVQATSERSLDPAEIASVVATVPEPGVPLVLEPREFKVAPRTEYDAKFSLQYSVAAMLVNGRVGPDTYTPAAITNPRVLELARRVEYEVKEFESYGTAFPGGVRIVLTSGETLAAELPYQRGGPQNPMSTGEIRRKFEENASLALPNRAVDALADGVLRLEDQTRLREFFSILGDAARRPEDGVSAWTF